MRKALIVIVLLQSIEVFAWGVTGHRAVGFIAELHLTKRAKKELKRVLGNESLALVTTWMDEIRSDHKYDHTHDWHWVSIPTGQTYEQTEKNPNGDVIATINRLTQELKVGGLTLEQEAEHVKMLAHLIGDIHQPLHVGTGEDRGGNDVKLKYFWQDSNLHRVWDSGMIDGTKLSYTELANGVNHASKAEIASWQMASVEEWAYESMALREQVYALPENKSINYRYNYDNWDIVEKRILQAGIRLAGVLNDIYN